MKLINYIKYYLQPFENKAIMLTAYMTTIASTFVQENFGLSIGLLLFYFFLAFCDFWIGIYKNIVVKNEAFSEAIFLMKIFVISLTTSFFYAVHQIEIWVANFNVPNVVLDYFQGVVVYSFSLVKIFVLVSFIAYELTCIKKSSIELKWNSLCETIEIFLKPIEWVKEKLQKNIKSEQRNL